MCFLFFQQPAEERPQAKSTGVFQDEELLFSQTQQKDNDPDVDLFATSGKAAVSILDICIYLYMFLFCLYAVVFHWMMRLRDYVYFLELQAQLREASSTKSVCR